MIAEKNCLTVAQLTKYVKRKFDADPYLNRNVYVVGQLTDFRLRKTHQYFSLKDDQADGKFQLSVVMFQSAFAKVKFTPEMGGGGSFGDACPSTKPVVITNSTPRRWK